MICGCRNCIFVLSFYPFEISVKERRTSLQRFTSARTRTHTAANLIFLYGLYPIAFLPHPPAFHRIDPINQSVSAEGAFKAPNLSGETAMSEKRKSSSGLDPLSVSLPLKHTTTKKSFNFPPL